MRVFLCLAALMLTGCMPASVLLEHPASGQLVTCGESGRYRNQRQGIVSCVDAYRAMGYMVLDESRVPDTSFSNSVSTVAPPPGPHYNF